MVPQMEDCASDDVVDGVDPSLVFRSNHELQLWDLYVAKWPLQNDAPKVLTAIYCEDH
eukprot:CAMPEP_0195031888 /NCGR_PEP_ID=MMETSP0326_2-20130528/62286_1 /TAXON_ID=2866 ORGANISM="Crypthecodinium cohnii, Strain Seligo" /NCGR_SAMPLE_ID=MMETSP0326_2 /ASSEMBLY_ACC=CAM_ASM_000348 /LENGTH=57 /DNA_ID=CAMNT_0040055791 /DNA_START=329 /DNA_END=499 /DNA_ORIENTATION=+